MSFEQRLSPSRVTAAAAASLTRWALFAVLAAYILPGLWGREPWSAEDASAFGVVWNMASGTGASWWLPGITGESVAEEGPLPFWLGAAFVKLLGPWLGSITAARLVTVFWFLIATWALWYATYRLARRDEAQPVALAFGGEATPRDYGRMLADVSVLFLTATFGVLIRVHETGAEPALLALVCITTFGLAFSLDDPWKGSTAAGLAIGGIVLTRGWLPAGVLLAAAIAFTLTSGSQRAARAALIALLAVVAFSLWPVGGPPVSSCGSRALFRRLVAMEPRERRHPDRRKRHMDPAQSRLVRLAVVAVCLLDDLFVASLRTPPAHCAAVTGRGRRACSVPVVCCAQRSGVPDRRPCARDPCLLWRVVAEAFCRGCDRLVLAGAVHSRARRRLADLRRLDGGLTDRHGCTPAAARPRIRTDVQVLAIAPGRRRDDRHGLRSSSGAYGSGHRCSGPARS